jgi:RNA polymerase sigma-70 factor, ECF subfamily
MKDAKGQASDDLRLVRAGDKPATERFVRVNACWMLAVARRYVKDDGLAEDCVQESFVSALRSLDKFKERSEIKTWLHRIVVNSCLMKIRSAQRAQEQSIDDLLPQFDAHDGRIEASWSQLATPDEILEQEQMRAFVRAKISELPDSYRIVLLLRDIEEFSTQEVAQLLGVSGAAVKVRLHRARSALKKLIEPILRREISGA